MPDIYNMADLMFLPSFDELFPMSILEALCCKKPILVRDIPLYRDILFDYCMKGNSSDEFATLINIVAKDASLYIQWSQKSWECHCLYSEERILQLWASFYYSAYSSLNEKKETAEKGNHIKRG